MSVKLQLALSILLFVLFAWLVHKLDLDGCYYHVELNEDCEYPDQ